MKKHINNRLIVGQFDPDPMRQGYPNKLLLKILLHSSLEMTSEPSSVMKNPTATNLNQDLFPDITPTLASLRSSLSPCWCGRSIVLMIHIDLRCQISFMTHVYANISNMTPNFGSAPLCLIVVEHFQAIRAYSRNLCKAIFTSSLSRCFLNIEVWSKWQTICIQHLHMLFSTYR